MYIHLGNEVTISDNDIIGIFDIENTSIGKITKNFLKHSGENCTVVNVSLEMPKSFILCKNIDGEDIIYISQISVSTLKKRSITLF